MAFGSRVFFRNYKDKSIQELEAILTKLRSSPCFVNVNRAIKKAGKVCIDSNAEFHQTHIGVIEMLIQYKTMYPNSDLSNCDDYRVVKRAVEDNAETVTME